MEDGAAASGEQLTEFVRGAALQKAERLKGKRAKQHKP